MKPEKKEDVKLTDAQRAKLQVCEIVIEDGQKAFLKTCIAVVVIDDLELYKPHKSLHAYCAFRFDYSDTETGRLRNAGHVLVNLSGLSADDLFTGKESPVLLPANEGQCREMAKLKKGKEQDADLQQKVWEEVLKRHKNGEKITAKLIRDVVDEMNGDGGSNVGDDDSATSPDGPCNAKLSIKFEDDEHFDLAQPLEAAAKHFGTDVARRKNTLTFGVEGKSREKLLHKLAGWAAAYQVTRIVVDFE